MSLRFASMLACVAGPALSLTLDMPASSKRVAEQLETLGSYEIPVTGYENGVVQSIWAEGEIRQQAWQVQSAGVTTLQLLAPLREQLADLQFETIFECEARTCGGFDFRYAMDVLPEPDMHVDLGDFRFLAAQRMAEDQPEYVSLLVSRSASLGYIQMTRIGTPSEESELVVTSTKSPLLVVNDSTPTNLPLGTGDLIGQLESRGRAVLEDLAFKTGSSKLDNDEFSSLAELATYLIANPTRAIVLVGHTDAEGSLAGNIALSKKRASAVRARLTGALGVPKAQVAAEGVGFLSPLASNLTEEGRTLNRRVEVILSVTE